MGSNLRVFRLECRDLLSVGTISTATMTFRYDDGYLSSARATPLSLSLPLSNRPYELSVFQPYFEGLLPEGEARRALAGELRLPEQDWLSLLAACGRDCIGDVVIRDEGDRDPFEEHGYNAMTRNDLIEMFLDRPSRALENATMRLSLAGAQDKTGLAHQPEAPMTEGWLQPKGTAATTHILKSSPLRDIPEIEYLCMSAANACGIRVANVSLLDLGQPILAVERFDRSISPDSADLHVTRLHQEDLAQAFGITPGSKYAELEGGSIRSIARFLRSQASTPALDILHFAQMLCFSYLIGDCDAHLKNYSLMYGTGRHPSRTALSLAPAYDLVCTTYFPRYRRDMAMSLGGSRNIDEVAPSTFSALARELGITEAALKRLASPLAERIEDAIRAAGDGSMGPVLESTPYIADGLIEDIAPRREILRTFCQ